MTITALSGPIVQFGTVSTSTAGTGLLGQDLEHNEQRGPMFSDLGDVMMDPRAAYGYQPGSAPTVLTLGFYSNIGDVDYIPITASTSAFVANSVVSSGVTTFTITASSSQGTFLTTIIAPETGKATGNLLAIDSTAASVTFGSAGTLGVWNPGAGTGRCVQIIASSSGDLGTYSVAGRDMYGYKMTETLAISQGTTNSSGTTIKGQKAFKYISAIANTSTPTSTGVSIGLTDIFGFPLAVPYAGLNAQIALLASKFSSAVIVPLSSASTILASTISVQTSTTPDVRGTYASTTASNGTLRVQIVVTPSASAIAAITSTNVAPLFGLTQFSSV